MKRTIFIGIFGLLTTSFAFGQSLNQTYVMTAGGFLNILKLPQELLWGITSPLQESAYNKKVKQTKSSPKMVVNGLSCSEKCFDDLRILSSGLKKMIPNSGENLLSFLNEKRDFANHYQRTVGYCWGHTSVTRSFNYLARFDPNRPIRNLKYYQHKIKRIVSGHAEVIEGFHDLREFSSVPQISNLLKDEVVWKWADQALRLNSIIPSLIGYTGLMKKPALLNFLAKVKEKLSVNHAPKIIFSNLKKPGFIHVVSVYDMIEMKDSVKLCILDNHQYEEDLRDCGIYVSIKLDGTKNYYSGWDDPKRKLEGFVGHFGFTPEDNIEMLNFQKQNTKMCLALCEQ